MTPRPIALLTDFGTQDQYVGSLKGVIASINPKAAILDITHEIRPQQIGEGAFVLSTCYQYFPKNTIFVVVVDPGVGSKRKAICVKAGNQFFLGPDNGTFTPVFLRSKNYEIREIQNDRFWRKPISSTFHGRDIFSPTAAHLSKKNVFKQLGPVLKNPVLLSQAKAAYSPQKASGEIVYIDRFGNGFTNINRSKLKSKNMISSIQVGNKKTAALGGTFASGSDKEMVAVWNSIDLLELAVRNDSAEKLFGIKVGDKVTVTFGNK